MLKKLNLTAVVLSALAAGSVLTASNVAFAKTGANLNSMSFNTQSAYNQVIHVVSTDKKKWNKIQPGTVQFWGDMKVDTKWPGFVWGVAVKLGQCGTNTCAKHPNLFVDVNPRRDYSHQRNFLVNTSQMPVSGAGISLVPYGNQILARCNQNLNYDGPTKEHSFDFEMTATLGAQTGTKVGNLDKLPVEVNETGQSQLGSIDKVRYGKFKVKVMCDPVERETAQDVPDDADFAAKGVKVFLSTFQGQTTKPNPGTVCKKARVLARINTTKAGPVKFNLWTKVGNGPSQKQFVQAWSSKSGSEYKAEFTKWISVSKTTKVQAMVEDKTNPIGQSSGWKDITLHCTGAGGGGLADKPKPDTGGGVAPLKVTGQMTLSDSAPNGSKPRLGQAVFKIWTNKPGNTSYKLTCAGGRKWEGTLQTYKVGNYKYRAVGAQNFQISKTEQIGCALRSTSKSGDPVIALATKLFKLVKTNPNVGGAGGITSGPKPTHGKPKLPKFKVAPKPKLPKFKVAPITKVSCIGGKVANNSCFCPAKTMKVKIGANAYRCIINVVKPVKKKSFIIKKK